MTTSQQEKEIKRLMRRIKDAKDQNMGEEAIKRRTRELNSYLQQQGLTNHLNE